MPRTLTLRKTLAAMTMAVAALWGGGVKAQTEQQGTLSIVEVQSTAALRPDQRKRVADYLRGWLQGESIGARVLPLKSGRFAVWSQADHSAALSRPTPTAARFGIHRVVRLATEADMADGPSEPGHFLAPQPDMDRPLVLSETPEIDGQGLESVSAGFSSYSNEPVINFKFTETATQTFADLTRDLVGESLAIVVDGDVLSAPIIQEPILGGSGQISGNFSVDGAQALVARLAPRPFDGELVVIETCTAAQPRAPPSWAPIWIAAEPACE